MMFSAIGSIQNHVKSMEMQLKWQQKQKNPGMVETDQASRGTSAPAGKYNAFALEQKLKTGQSLSSEEMQYLQNNYPDLYSQAVDAERERQSYKSQLNGCQTKDDVMRANMHRVAALHDELTSVQNNPNLSQGEKFKRSVGIHMKAQAVSDEHSEFQRSGEYQKLPTEQELAEKSKEAERQKEQAETKETERQEEKAPDTADPIDGTSDQQTADIKPGENKEPSVVEPEAPQPALDAAEAKPAPESATPQPQIAHSYTPKGYAVQSTAHGSGSPHGGMNVEV